MNIIEEYSNLGQSNYLSGKVIINQETCTGCKQCEIICPASCLEVVEVDFSGSDFNNNKTTTKKKTKKARMMVNRDCISCGACIAVCKDNCIRMGNFWKIPNGGYKTLAKQQSTGQDSFPRYF